MIVASQIISTIEKQLRELADPQAAMTRVRAMNLVVVADSLSVAERYTPVVDEVTASLLARAFVVGLDPGSKEGVLVGSAVPIRAPEGGKDAVSERVSLRAQGQACLRIPSVLEAICVPEVPTVLVWLGKLHPSDAIFEQLAGRSERVVIDSEYTSLSSVVALAEFVRAHPEGPQAADLAWTRLAPWQELFARFFDQESHAAFAHHIDRIVIAQASRPGARLGSQAALMLGWLATRLGLHPYRAGGAVRFVRADGTEVTTDFIAVPCPQEVAPATLAALSFVATRGERVHRGSIVRDLGSGGQAGATDDADVIAWHLEPWQGAALDQHVRLGTNKAAKWLERTLRRPAKDMALLESVTFAEHVAEDEVRAATNADGIGEIPGSAGA